MHWCEYWWPTAHTRKKKYILNKQNTEIKTEMSTTTRQNEQHIISGFVLPIKTSRAWNISIIFCLCLPCQFAIPKIVIVILGIQKQIHDSMFFHFHKNIHVYLKVTCFTNDWAILHIYASVCYWKQLFGSQIVSLILYLQPKYFVHFNYNINFKQNNICFFFGRSKVQIRGLAQPLPFADGLFVKTCQQQWIYSLIYI